LNELLWAPSGQRSGRERIDYAAWRSKIWARLRGSARARVRALPPSRCAVFGGRSSRSWSRSPRAIAGARRACAWIEEISPGKFYLRAGLGRKSSGRITRRPRSFDSSSRRPWARRWPSGALRGIRSRARY
jgi:hypothetical protein